MQVTHAADHVTHAVIANGQSHAFGINDSVEFFRILSSSLYSDKKLAVVREIACNAWDAHIEAGCTDKAIEITLTRSKLVIRDFGPGMSHANILKLYTTYGGTTKVANENVTGGFGLGSKAPFAYADHFQVISRHKGKQTIYHMSLSAAEVDGKPSVMTIMDLPCDPNDSGIEVSVDIKDEYDVPAFEKIIRRIVSHGEMKATLGAELLPTVPFSQAPNGFVILPNELLGKSPSRIYIRYGHVIYPVSETDQFSSLTYEARQFLQEINANRSHNYHMPEWGVVLQAGPGAVSVTPSRETLSMTDRTIATIKELLEKFIKDTSVGIEPECHRLLEEAVQAAWADGVPGQLVDKLDKLPNWRWFENLRTRLPKQIYHVEQAAAHYLAGGNYPSREDFHVRDLEARLQAMLDQSFGDRSLIISYRNELRKTIRSKRVFKKRSHADRKGYRVYESNWFHQKVIWPLLRDFQGTSLLEKNLFVVEHGFTRNRSTSELLLQTANGHYFNNFGGCMPYLRKVLFLSHNRIDIIDGGSLHPEMAGMMGSAKGCLAYVVPRNAKKIVEARKFFKARGYHVIDFTPDQELEKPDPATPKAPPKPKRKGVPLLANLGSSLNVGDAYYGDDNKLIEKPEFVTIISPNHGSFHCFTHMSSDHTHPIIQLYGDRGAIVPTTASQDKYVEAGAKKLEDWLPGQLLKEIKRSTLIAQYHRNYRPADVHLDHDELEVLKMIRQDEELRKKFKLTLPLPDRERKLLTLFEAYHSTSYSKYPELMEIHELKKTWTASPAMKKVAEALTDNVIIDALHVFSVRSLMASQKPESVAKARKIILFAMKG